MNEHHRVNVIRITEVRPHGNADKLEIIPIEGYRAVVAKGQFKVGDLAYYIPPDSIVPDRPEFEFLWGGAKFETGVPVSKRRVTAKKLRGEWSEGLLMPIETHLVFGPSVIESGIHDEQFIHPVREGDDIAPFLGITHYNAAEPTPVVQKRKRVFPRSLRGWKRLMQEECADLVRQIKGSLYEEDTAGNPGLPDYSIQALKKFPNALQDGEMVRVTEKIHGSNARYMFKKNRLGLGGKMYVGTHYTWRAADSTCDWARALRWNKWIEPWCRQNPGYALYGEIVPTQSRYNYGTIQGEIKFFVFDVKDPQGEWLTRGAGMCLYPSTTDLIDCIPDVWVPTLYAGQYDESIKKLADGKTKVSGADHIREGIVIETLERPERLKLKIVSNAFLEAEKR